MTVSGQGLRHHADNRPSMLLSAEENQMVIALVGPRCQTLATTVAQVYRSEGPGHNYRWNKRTCGVICFVKDNLRRSYFIRVYDMDRTVLVFDQEIYNQFRYKAPRPYFHTFEGDDAQIGLNFADEAEAEIFQKTVESKLTERRKRRERRQASRKQQGGHSDHGNGAAKHGVQNGGVAGDVGGKAGGVAPLQTVQINRRDQGGQAGKKVDKKKLKKEDIGMPTNFQHISHVGWDPNHGFDLENVDPNLKKFFHKAGVDEKALQDKDTRDFIYDFIDKHGGVEAALREVNSNGNSMELTAAPPPPPRSLTNPGQLSSRPPPPSRVQAAAPPPPPPTSAPSNRSAPSHRAPPPPAPAVQIKDTPAPPPPPPPPPSAPAPPPTSLLSQMSSVVSGPPPPPPSLPPIDTSHGNLMDEIRKGGSLRHVSPEKKVRAVADSRGELMGQIRQGVALKKVDSDPGQDGPVTQQAAPGIAGMLQRALQERGMVMGMSSSEDDDSGDEDDEWDD